MSAATSERKAGTAGTPVEGPANTRLADWVLRVPVRVPADVTGLPDTLNILGSARPTEVTEPAVLLIHDGLADGPDVPSTWPDVPGGKATQLEAFLYRMLPWAVEVALSIIAVSVFATGTAELPVILDNTVPAVMVAREMVLSADRSPPPVRPAPVLIALAVGALLAKSVVRLVTWDSAICMATLAAAVSCPWALTVYVGTCVAEP